MLADPAGNRTTSCLLDQTSNLLQSFNTTSNQIVKLFFKK